MPILMMMKGLPASGKTTKAKRIVSDAPVNSWKRVNKDDLRSMLDNGRYSKASERLVLDTRDWIVENALINGVNVIVDDTNLDPKHEDRLREIANVVRDNGMRVEFHIDDLTDVSYEECIKRNRERSNPIPDKVIYDMYKKYLASDVEVPIFKPRDTGKHNAIIVDMDGTMCHHTGIRGHHEYEKVFDDEPNYHITEMVTALSDQYKILIVSGRPDSCEEETRAWLDAHFVPYDDIFMRQDGDYRKDSIIKRELYEAHIAPDYDVQFVLDDRDQVVEMWRRELNLPCLQVNYGNF